MEARTEAFEKAKKNITESKTREQLKTARNYVDKFAVMYGPDAPELSGLNTIISDKDKELSTTTFNWKDIGFEAFGAEVNSWCKILCIDIERDSIILESNALRIHQILSETPFRSSK